MGRRDNTNDGLPIQCFWNYNILYGKIVTTAPNNTIANHNIVVGKGVLLCLHSKSKAQKEAEKKGREFHHGFCIGDNLIITDQV